ncbi:hypothetical protein MtrunA17_Chr3g0107251 [Medicago truncatula]|uniref:DUF247 domain protein n=1 Tax=Medicago truncatula TaxID=3880 RepID=A0A072UYF4_MEDTR|nr:UPF0481 protein At3g47200 [Medicago truncatula]KEH34456.1 DUF247 domain protein [Medicago truncatula]RHN67853.1 hypothetical protein MtrunA17_Chr3g0107251 [Medicago truncatula]
MAEEDSKNKNWKKSTKALLRAVRKETCQPYSISVVPDDLRKWNKSAYIPKVVSIGPRYRGERELLQMEEIKWRCVTSLLSRTFGLDAIEMCMEAVMDLESAVRSSYVDEITLDWYTLATTMVFDGCFLLELLICESNLDSEIPIPFNGTSPGIEVKKMEYVISDLLLLENQIPIFILEKLFEKLLGSSHQMRELIQNLALRFFGFSEELMFKSAFHFLDIKYSYMEMGWMDEEIEETEVRPRLPDMEEEEEEKEKKRHLNRCATRLKAAGITIQCLNNNADRDITERKNFKFTTEFDKSKGILLIPTLCITQTTEALWRSFIAWEHHKKKLKTGSSSPADRRSSVCTSSALLFRDLVCCSSDVQLLKDSKVIVDNSKKSNRDLVAFFHSIAGGVDRSIIDQKHITMFQEMNIFSTANYATKIFILLCHFFSKILDWYYKFHEFLKRGYNFAATIVTFLTVVQTCYAIIAYHFPR